MRRFALLFLVAGGSVAAAVAAWGLMTEPAVSRDTRLACPADSGTSYSTAIDGHIDYRAAGGSRTPEAAVRSAAMTMKMPGLPSQVLKVASSSTEARFEMPDGQGVLLASKRGGRWMVERTAMCQQVARELVQP